jgi:hypothetical protein
MSGRSSFAGAQPMKPIEKARAYLDTLETKFEQLMAKPRPGFNIRLLAR